MEEEPKYTVDIGNSVTLLNRCSRPNFFINPREHYKLYDALACGEGLPIIQMVGRMFDSQTCPKYFAVHGVTKVYGIGKRFLSRMGLTANIASVSKRSCTHMHALDPSISEKTTMRRHLKHFIKCLRN